MAQRVNPVDRPGMKKVISQLMDHFGIRYTSHILDEVTLLQHFRKVNSAMNGNGVPKNPDNPDGVPFPIRVLPEQEVTETKNITVAEEVVVEEQIEINHRTKTETKKSQTSIRKTILITKTTFKEKSK